MQISCKSHVNLMQILCESQANLRQISGKSQANLKQILRQIVRKFQTNPRQISDKSQANLRQICGKSYANFMQVKSPNSNVWSRVITQEQDVKSDLVFDQLRLTKKDLLPDTNSIRLLNPCQKIFTFHDCFESRNFYLDPPPTYTHIIVFTNPTKDNITMKQRCIFWTILLGIQYVLF